MRGAIYARYSCEKQREESISGQIRDCEAYAKRENIKIVKTYKDEALSARTDKRPSFQRMIRDAMNGDFECIIVWKGDRFSRNRGDAATYKAQLKKKGVRVLYAAEVNVDGPESILLEGISEAYAEFYSVELGVKVSRGMRENTLEGKWNGGTLSYGYEINSEGRYVINEQEAALVRELFSLYTHSTISVLQISKQFEEKGYVNRKGVPFSSGTLHNMLSREIYVGVTSFNDIRNEKGAPAIIDRVTFEKARDKMAANKKERSTFKGKEGFLLSGIVFSGDTGQRLNADAGTSRTGKVHYYYSNRAHRKKGEPSIRYTKVSLESAVVECVFSALKKRSMQKKMASQIFAYANNEDPSLQRAEAALAQTTTSIKKYMTLLESGCDVDDIRDRLMELSQIKENQLKEIARLKNEGSYVSKDDIESFFDSASSSEILSFKGKQLLIDNFVKAVLVYGNEAIEIFYKFRGFQDANDTFKDGSVGKPIGSPNWNPPNR